MKAQPKGLLLLCSLWRRHQLFPLQNYIKKMRFIKFLSVLEKSIIVVIILCFVPIAIFAIAPKRITTNTAIESSFSQVNQQTSYSGYLTTMIAGAPCNSLQVLALMNEKYLERCVIGINCYILPSNSPCSLPKAYIVNSMMICSAKTVSNQYVPADTVSFEQNASSLPLASLTFSQGKLINHYYCILDMKECKQLLSGFRYNIEQSFSDNYETFSMVIKYLMYFGLIPLIAHTILVFVLDSFCKYNLRLTNSLMIIHQSLIGAGIIIAGIAYNSNNDDLISKLGRFPSNCIINHPQCSSLSSPFATFTAGDGISSGFVTAMCFVLALQILLIIGVVILNILMVKYYKLREIDPTLSGYQLQTL